MGQRPEGISLPGACWTTPHAVWSPQPQGNQVNFWQESQVWQQMVALPQKYSTWSVLPTMADVLGCFETMTGPGNRESNLANASSIVLFWLVSPENDPDHSLSSHNLCPLVVAPKEGAFNLQISSFPSDRPNQRSLVVNKNTPRLSKEGTGWSYENSFVFCPLTPPTSSISISDMWHWDETAIAAALGRPLGQSNS